MDDQGSGPLRGFLRALVLVVAGIGPAQAISPQDTRVARLVDLFDTVVFGAEYDITAAKTIITKWVGPVAITAQGRSIANINKIVNGHLNILARFTGLQFRLGKKGAAEQRIDLIFLKKRDLKGLNIDGVDRRVLFQLMRKGPCFFVSKAGGNGRITWAAIVANSEQPEKDLTHCLLEELTQSLGLGNDTSKVRPSLFSDEDRLLAP